jgi:ketosteroid isomerase-like protein
VKTGLLLALAWLAISVALPTLEQTTVASKTRQEIEAVAMQFVEAYNKHDAPAIAALYTQDAVRMEDWNSDSLHVGREAIEKDFAEYFAASFPPTVPTPVQMYAIEGRIAAISEYSVGHCNGHIVRIYIRDADTWRIRMEFVTGTNMPLSTTKMTR